MVFATFGEDHAVDEDARDLHLPWVQVTALGDALDLHDDPAAGVVRRHRDGEGFER